MSEHSLRGIVDGTPTTAFEHLNTSSDRASDLPAMLGRNLRRLRTRKGYSLERLATASGVSRAMISQVETAKSVPTMRLLWRLTNALNVELASLLAAQTAPATAVLRRASAKTIEVSGGRFTTRPLFQREARGVEFFEVSIARGHEEQGERRAPGVRAHVVVARGSVAVSVDGAPATALVTGDAMIFAADAEHSYRNIGDADATLYLVFYDPDPHAFDEA